MFLIPGFLVPRFLVPAFLVSGFAVLAAACAPASHANPIYTHDTRLLVRLDYDHNADGVIDVRTYMRDGKPVRLEGDVDGDGRIDRWEYYGVAGELLRIGGSTQADGREDTWARTVEGRTHVDVSTRRDGTIDRREIHRGDVLLRVELDTNHDGRADRWEEFDEGRLARVLFDESFTVGRPTRRIVYGRGEDVAVETDPDGDGRFTPVAETGTAVKQEARDVAR